MKTLLKTLLALALLVVAFPASAIQIGADTDLQAPSGQGGTQRTVNVPRVSADLNLGGIIYQDFTATTTTGTSATTLYSYTVPANTINAGGRGLKITMWGTTAATADDKTQIISVGGTTFCTTGVTTGSAKPWKIEVIIYRTTSAAVGQAIGGGVANDAIVAPQWVATTIDWSTAITILGRTTDEVAGGTLGKGFQIEAF